MSDYLPKYFPGFTVPITVTVPVAGGSLVTVTGTVPGDASTVVAGVVGPDAPTGALVTTYRTGIHRLLTSAAVTVGQPLCSGPSTTVSGVTVSTVRPWVAGTDPVAAYLGTAWSTAASGASVDAAIYAV